MIQKQILLGAFLLASLCAATQTIPLEKLLSLAHKPFSAVSDSLIEDGFEYAGVDTSQNTKYCEAIIWAYHFDNQTQSAENWVITFRNFQGDTVDRINENLTKEAYQSFIKKLPSLHFTEDATKHTDGYGLSKLYFRAASMIEIKAYLKKNAAGANENAFAIAVVKLLEDEEYEKIQTTTKN